MSSLLSIEGIHLGRRFPLREKFRIGRASDNDLILQDHLVSRYHAEILHNDNGFLIHDLGSKNGFQINGVNATESHLNPGDLLRIGQTVLTFEAPRQVQAARFSDTLIHLSSDQESPARFYDPQQLPDSLEAGPAMVLIDKVGNLFESGCEELPEALHSLVKTILETFDADKGTIILRSSSGEPHPMVAIAEEGEIYLDEQTIHRLLTKGRPVMASARINTGGELIELPRHAMMVPLIQSEKIIGVLQLERTHKGEFKPTDLTVLYHLSKIISGIVHHVMQRDLVRQAEPERSRKMIIGASLSIDEIRLNVQRAAQSDATVLLTGETGSGKELVANEIHAASRRAEGPFVAINCAAIPHNLIESELFGHEAGSFTGARQLKRGKVEMAEGGTLFLDEIGEMQIELQPKLLRFLEDQTFNRVGGLHSIQADVRIIAATNRELTQAIEDGRFREDLLYRLNVLPIHLPPLRKRKEDIRLLVEHFAPSLSARLGKPFNGLLEDTWQVLESYPWPGNVRELRHTLERAIILSDDGILRKEHFQLTVPTPEAEISGSATSNGSGTSTRHQSQTRREPTMPLSLSEAEIEAIKRALRYAGGNRVKAAHILKIHRNTLAKKLQDYQIEI